MSPAEGARDAVENGGPRVVVVGTGAISQIVHVPILAEREDVNLVAVSDVDLPKARAIAERLGIAEVVKPEAALGRPDLDAVVICTPNHLHEEMAVAALEAGKHVFVERPVAITPQRFRPEVAALRAFVASGEAGHVYAVRGSWLTRRTPRARTTWRQDPKLSGGGALMDLGVPSLDVCLWLLGYPPVKRLSCVTTRGDEVENAATLMAETDDGVAITLEVSSRYFAGQDRYYARVMGTEGSGSLPPLELYRQLGGRPLEVTPRQPRPRGGENPYMNAYRRQLDHFVRAVGNRAEAPPPEEQVRLMAVIQAAYRAAEEGVEVAP
jgi:predicted dehydrogenase